MPLRASRRGESSYRLLTQWLREQNFRDEFDEVQPLPTELVLTREHHLSRQTVRRAFQELVAEGLVYRVQGRGTFVTPRETRYRRPFGTVGDLLNLQVDTDFELVAPLSVTVDPGAATTLRLDEPQIHSLTLLRRHHGEAFCLTRVYLPPRIAASLAGCRELTDPGIHTTSTLIGLIESHGNDIAEAEQVAPPRPPTRRSPPTLGAPPAYRSCTSNAPTWGAGARYSSTLSATSCPSTTRTGHGSGAAWHQIHHPSCSRSNHMRPLEGLTVVSIEQAVAAPFATRQLADLGARVIKVERPGAGDFARNYDETVKGMSSHFVWLNRSKESIALDLKTAAGRAAMQALVAKADVFVQNLAPGAAERLGLGAETLRAKHPGLVHVSISGYGDGGPYTNKKAYDLLVQCEAGLVSITGTADEPSKVGISVADIAAGMYAYTGVLTALLRKGQTGQGATVEISMLEALAEWMGFPMYFSCVWRKISRAQRRIARGDRPLRAVSVCWGRAGLPRHPERARVGSLLRQGAWQVGAGH